MVVDLTLPLEEGMLAFPGYPEYRTETLQGYERDGKRSHRFEATTHTGTHIDAPAHFIEDGATIDELDLQTLTGPTKIADLRSHNESEITASVLDTNLDDLESGDRVLLLTGDVDSLPHTEEFFDRAAVLTEDAAEWLVDKEIQLLGNDFLTESVDAHERPVHETLLGADIPIVEYLRNTSAIVGESTVHFACLPLRMTGLEAAPARAIAKQME